MAEMLDEILTNTYGHGRQLIRLSQTQVARTKATDLQRSDPVVQ